MDWITTALGTIAETPEIPDIKKPEIEIENVVLFYSGSIKNLPKDGEVSANGMSGKYGVLVLFPPGNGVFQTFKL